MAFESFPSFPSYKRGRSEHPRACRRGLREDIPRDSQQRRRPARQKRWGAARREAASVVPPAVRRYPAWPDTPGAFPLCLNLLRVYLSVSNSQADTSPSVGSTVLT